jgi:hypothetical protein
MEKINHFIDYLSLNNNSLEQDINLKAEFKKAKILGVKAVIDFMEKQFPLLFHVIQSNIAWKVPTDKKKLKEFILKRTKEFKRDMKEISKHGITKKEINSIQVNEIPLFQNTKETEKKLDEVEPVENIAMMRNYIWVGLLMNLELLNTDVSNCLNNSQRMVILNKLH